MKYILTPLLLLFLLLSGCLVKPYIPVPDLSYSVENRFAIVQKEDLNLYVRPQIYNGEAQSVSSNFFTLYLRVKNNSTQTVALDPKSFSVIASEQQFDYIPLQLVLGSIGSTHRFSQYEDPFAQAFPETQDQYWQQAQDHYFELMNNYFSFGDILPGGIKEGYLFYNGRVRQADSFLLDAFGTRVTFSRK